MSNTVRDAAARQQALDPHGSFIVQAPAGSGKTELLIQRFLTLLDSETVEQPEAVVAITFTKKAAGEMRHRVISAIQSAASDVVPDSLHEKTTWEISRRVRARDQQLSWHLEQYPSRLRIQTIDSFCSSLVRQMPWISRMGAAPRPEEDASLLYRMAARETIAALESDGPEAASLERVLVHLDNNVGTLETLLARMLARRDQWLRHVAPNAAVDAFRLELHAALAQIVVDELSALRNLFPPETGVAIAAMARLAAKNLELQGMDNFLSAFLTLEGLPDASPDSQSAWNALAQILLTKDGKRRKTLNKNDGFPPGSDFKEVKERCLSIWLDEDLVRRLHAVRSLPPASLEDAQWSVLGALIHALMLAVANLKVIFQRNGAVDFSEISQAARMALGTSEDPTDLAFALDCRIQHLLVDEFQDTSQSQFALLESLTANWQPGDGRTLFLVGDPMQSIYGFREADVSLFLRARQQGVSLVALTPLTLTVNFRSDQIGRAHV